MQNSLPDWKYLLECCSSMPIRFVPIRSETAMVVVKSVIRQILNFEVMEVFFVLIRPSSWCVKVFEKSCWLRRLETIERGGQNHNSRDATTQIVLLRNRVIRRINKYPLSCFFVVSATLSFWSASNSEEIKKKRVTRKKHSLASGLKKFCCCCCCCLYVFVGSFFSGCHMQCAVSILTLPFRSDTGIWHSETNSRET